MENETVENETVENETVENATVSEHSGEKATDEERDDVLKSEPNPAEVKRERKNALASVAIVHQSRDQYDVNSIVADAPDGAIVKCRDDTDMYGIFFAAAKVGKTFNVVHRPNQEVRMRWQIPGSR